MCLSAYKTKWTCMMSEIRKKTVSLTSGMGCLHIQSLISSEIKLLFVSLNIVYRLWKTCRYNNFIVDHEGPYGKFYQVFWSLLILSNKIKYIYTE